MNTDTLYFDVVSPLPPRPDARARLVAWLHRFGLIAAVVLIALVGLAAGTFIALVLLGLTPFVLAGTWFVRRRLARAAADIDPTIG